MAEYPLNYILEHASKGSGAKDTVTVDGETTNDFYLKADYGYKFVASVGNENCPTLERKDSEGNDKISYFASWGDSTLTNDYREYTAHLKLLTTSNFPPFYIRAIAVRNDSVILRTLNVSNNVEGATFTYKQTASTTFEFTLTGDTEGTFSDTPKITLVDAYGSTVTKSMTVNGNVATLTTVTTDDNITVEGSFTPTVKEIPITYNSTNSTITPTPESVSIGGSLAFAVQTENDYVITSVRAVWIDIYGASNVINGTIDDDKKTATLTLTATSSMKSIEIQATAVASSPSVSLYGSINAYVVDNDMLNEFAKTRFRESTGYILTEIDLGDYVNRLKNLYVNVPDSYKVDDTLRCGNYNTGISCKSINNAILTYDFGSISLTPLYDSSFEYENTELQLYLPFVGLVSVPNDIIGHVIGLKCDINLVTGYGTYGLYDQSIGMDVPIVITPFEPSSDIIFNVGYDYNVIGGDKWNENQMLKGSPMLLRKCGNPRGKYIYDTYETGDVNTFPKGYMELTDIHIDHEGLSSEVYNEILRIMQSGFYYNG